MRPSKNLHLLARLRHELGSLASQDYVAQRINVHPKTIQRIETGRRKLTRLMAERLGDAFDVDPLCLMENNLETGLRNREGRRWTAKNRREIQNRLRRWGDLEPYARQAQRGVSAALLYQYLKISHIIRKLPEPEDRLIDWVRLFDLAISALIYSQPKTRQWSRNDFRPKGTLETVFDDLQAIWSDQRLIKRIEKRQTKQQKEDNDTLELKRTYAEMLGWNERGLIAAQLIEETKEDEEMTNLEFIDLVQERCLKEGVSWPERFDPFEAIVAWQEDFKKHVRRVKK